MYVVYYGIGNSFSGSMAAKIHLNQLPQHKPDEHQLKSLLPAFLELEERAFGRLIYIGSDSHGNQVFLLNVGAAETIILPAFKSVFDLLQISQEQVILVDLTTVNNSLFYIGRFLYKIKLKVPGLTLMALGINKLYDTLNAMLEDKFKIIFKRS